MQYEILKAEIENNKNIRHAEGRSERCYVVWQNLLDLILDEHSVELNFLEAGINVKAKLDSLKALEITDDYLLLSYGGTYYWGIPLDGCSVTLHKDDCAFIKEAKWKEIRNGK